MKRKLIILLILFILIFLGRFAWFLHRPSPVLQFAGLRAEKDEWVTVIFDITNDSNSAFCYADGSMRVPTAFGWKVHPPEPNCTGPGYVTVGPYSKAEYIVLVPKSWPNFPFEVGLQFERGTAAEFAVRSRSKSSRFFRWIRSCLGAQRAESFFTWSTPAVISQDNLKLFDGQKRSR